MTEALLEVQLIDNHEEELRDIEEYYQKLYEYFTSI
jgi:hypothetical protein